MRPHFRHWAALLGLIALILLADQATKIIVASQLAPGQTVIPIPFLSDFFRITYSQNTGAAFGLLPQLGGAFSIAAVIVSIGLLFAHHKMPAGAWGRRISIALIIGGALGNVIDRVRIGYVIDFINYRIPDLISNVSNIADHAIVFGVILMLILTWNEEEDPAPAAEPEA